MFSIIIIVIRIIFPDKQRDRCTKSLFEWAQVNISFLTGECEHTFMLHASAERSSDIHMMEEQGDGVKWDFKPDLD